MVWSLGKKVNSYSNSLLKQYFMCHTAHISIVSSLSLLYIFIHTYTLYICVCICVLIWASFIFSLFFFTFFYPRCEILIFLIIWVRHIWISLTSLLQFCLLKQCWVIKSTKMVLMSSINYIRKELLFPNANYLTAFRTNNIVPNMLINKNIYDFHSKNNNRFDIWPFWLKIMSNFPACNFSSMPMTYHWKAQDVLCTVQQGLIE